MRLTFSWRATSVVGVAQVALRAGADGGVVLDSAVGVDATGASARVRAPGEAREVSWRRCHRRQRTGPSTWRSARGQIAARDSQILFEINVC